MIVDRCVKQNYMGRPMLSDHIGENICILATYRVYYCGTSCPRRTIAYGDLQSITFYGLSLGRENGVNGSAVERISMDRASDDHG